MKEPFKSNKNQLFDLRRNQELSDSTVFSRRSLIAFGAYIVGILTLAGRAFYLQINRREYYQTRSENNRVKFSVLAPVRGNIYDRNGVELSENVLSYNLVLNRSKTQSISDAFGLLPQYLRFGADDAQKYDQAKRAISHYGNVIVREDLSEDEINQFLVHAYLFPGFEITPSYKRNYPFGEYTAHLVGYVQNINEKDLKSLDILEYQETKKIGRTGIEQFYERRLHGKAGYQQAEISSQGKIIRVLESKRPSAGDDLQLSLDIRLQKIITTALENYRGAAVAIDPRNGEVLAMVSMPSYDANWFVEGISQKRYDALLNSDDKPLFNRALNGRYPPASTLKPLIALAALHYGLATTDSEVFCAGSYQIPNFEDKKKFHCWKRAGHGHVNLNRSLVESCDIYYYSLGYDLGIDRLHRYLAQFKLGLQTGIDLPNEGSGILPSRDWKTQTYNKRWFVGDTINSSIGQGYVATTPLQMAYFTALIASRGQCVSPHLWPHSLVQTPHIEQNNALAWEAIQKAMFDTVYSGTGTARSISELNKFKISGKTGTAQVFSFRNGQRVNRDELAAHLRDNSAFICYAPSEKPRIALGVMIENAGGGSEVATPVAAKILGRYFAELKDDDSNTDNS